MQSEKSHLVHKFWVSLWHTLHRLLCDASTIDGQWFIWSYRVSSGILFLWTARLLVLFCCGSSSESSTESPRDGLPLRFFVCTLSPTSSESQVTKTLLTDVAKDRRSSQSFLGIRRCSQWRLYRIQPCTTHEDKTQKNICRYNYLDLWSILYKDMNSS